MATELYNHLFKLLILGDSGVGKSSLLMRFTHGTFPPDHLATIGVDVGVRTVSVDNEMIKLQIWDTAGQERFRTITKTFYRGTQGVVVVYDVTNAESYRNVQRWLEEIEDQVKDIERVLVGNKNENPSVKVVPTEDATEFANKLGIPFFETSVIASTDVDEIFLTITKQILDKHKIEIERKKKEDNTKIKIVSRSRPIKRKPGRYPC